MSQNLFDELLEEMDNADPGLEVGIEPVQSMFEESLPNF